MTTICKCGIAAMDCEYHRPSVSALESLLSVAQRLREVGGDPGWTKAPTGINFASLSPDERYALVCDLHTTGRITIEQFKLALNLPLDEDVIYF